jgi:mycofactocin precursor peptide peptidase
MGASALLVLPVGSLEQHGPHLPLDTDTQIAVELCRRLVAALSSQHAAGVPAARSISAVIAPALAYGASGEHAQFPGTLSVGTPVLADAVVELVRSARRAFAGVVVVSGHGGNAQALEQAVRRCRYEGDRILLAAIYVAGSDAHAGRTETSMMMALDSAAVRLDQAAAGRTEPLRQLLPELRQRGVRAVSENGVLGDPTGATAEEGRRVLAAATAGLVQQVAHWWATGDGEHRTAGATVSTAPQGRR